MANMKIEEIEGIGPAMGDKLRGAGVADTDTLMEKACTKDGRVALAAASGIDEGKILSWVNMADLCRIKGVGEEYSELLHAAGVDTVKELKTRRADNLTAKLVEVNDAKNLTRRVPTEDMVTDWIGQAAGLPPKIEH